ncbi:MAG: guanosine-3',5'-bis pyrophosphate 3'-pyrophosphohydrolase [Candidatus Peregrinibacteria bacterium Greene1014_49]|nr:MAG: guanosine-3',5'-bis pyrophosphate 3'-pyrophosphohydrolase [Candidatus Peregrinibacteria bacterium Greene1014_49]
MAASTYLPSNVYAAAVLHDVIEDTELTYADLIKSVGRPIATTVLGLSRPQRLLGEGNLTWEKRYLKQMLAVQTLEPSILLIKLADRIHNLETQTALAPDRRTRLLETTRNLYLPFFESARNVQPPSLQFAYENLLGQLRRLCTVPEKQCVTEAMLVTA